MHFLQEWWRVRMTCKLLKRIWLFPLNFTSLILMVDAANDGYKAYYIKLDLMCNGNGFSLLLLPINGSETRQEGSQRILMVPCPIWWDSCLPPLTLSLALADALITHYPLQYILKGSLRYVQVPHVARILKMYGLLAMDTNILTFHDWKGLKWNLPFRCWPRMQLKDCWTYW